MHRGARSLILQNDTFLSYKKLYWLSWMAIWRNPVENNDPNVAWILTATLWAETRTNFGLDSKLVLVSAHTVAKIYYIHFEPQDLETLVRYEQQIKSDSKSNI